MANEIRGRESIYKINQNDCFWNMLCRLDEKRIKLDSDDIQNKRGVYIFWNWEDYPIRIGKAVKVRNRIISYYTGTGSGDILQKMQNEISHVSVIYVNNEMESAALELELLDMYKPKYNYHSINPNHVRTD